MKKIFFLLTLGVITLSNQKVTAQSSFVKSYGLKDFKEEAFSVNPISEGGFIVGGYRESRTGTISRDALIMALDANGSVLWSKTYDLGEWESIFCIKPKSSGGYIAVGCKSAGDATGFNSSGKTFAISLKSDGTLEWAKAYDTSGVNDFGLRVLEVNDKHFVISGRWAKDEQASGGLTIDIDGNGNTLSKRFLKAYTNGINTYFGDVILDKNNDYLISGFSSYNSNQTDNDPIVIKLSHNSVSEEISKLNTNTLTNKIYHGSDMNQGSYSITRGIGDGYFTSGNYWDSDGLGLYFMALKNDLSINKQERYVDNTSDKHDIRSNIIKQVFRGKNNYYISPVSDEENFNSSPKKRKAGLVLANDDCSIEWASFYYFSNKDAYSYDACGTTDGGYVTVGYTNAFSTGTDDGNILVVKTNEKGQVVTNGNSCFIYESDVLIKSTKDFTVKTFEDSKSKGVKDVKTTALEDLYQIADNSCSTPGFCGCPNTTNLIMNGDFESGAIGFTSKFTQMITSLVPGSYTVAEYASYKNFCSNWNVSNPASCPRTGAMQGKFLVVNGQTGVQGFRTAWGQTMTVETGKDYKLCLNLKNLPQCCFDVKPVIRIMFNYGSQSNFIGPITVNQANTACDWLKYTTTISIPPGGSPTTLLSINIDLDQSGLGDGNDIAIDDISLIQLKPMDMSLIDCDIKSQFINTTQYNLTAIPNLSLPAGAGYYWEVFEIDPTTSLEIPGTKMSNPPSWWTPICSFPGYGGATPGVFTANKMYRIVRGTWSECNSWGAMSWDIRKNVATGRIEIKKNNDYKSPRPKGSLK